MNKTKTENELENAILWVGDVIHEILAIDFDAQMDEARVYEDGGILVREEDEARIREDFEYNNTVETVLNALKEDKDFKQALANMVNYIACNRGV
jgi:hypothetical protein